MKEEMFVALAIALMTTSATLAAERKAESRPFELKWTMVPNQISREDVLKHGSRPIKVADHFAHAVVAPTGDESISIGVRGKHGETVLKIAPDYKGFLPAYFGKYAVACVAEPYHEERIIAANGGGWSYFQFLCLLDDTNSGVFDKAFVTKRVKTGFPEFESDIKYLLPVSGRLSYVKTDSSKFSYSTTYAIFEEFVATDSTHNFVSVSNVGGSEIRRFSALGQSVSDQELSQKGSLAFLDWHLKRNQRLRGMFPR